MLISSFEQFLHRAQHIALNTGILFPGKTRCYPIGRGTVPEPTHDLQTMIVFNVQLEPIEPKPRTTGVPEGSSHAYYSDVPSLLLLNASLCMVHAT